MSTAQQDSSLQIVLPPGEPRAPSGETAASSPKALKRPPSDALTAAQAEAAGAGVWLDGDVLACACPECHGPMSIRLWLLVADCWMCGTSIELTEQQERAALKLLEARQKEPAASPSQQSKSPGMTPRSSSARAVPPALPRPTIRPAEPARPALPAQAAAPRPARHLGPATMGAIARRKAHDWLRDLPAWLVSLIFHIVAMLLLGLLTISNDDPRRREILLTATMGKPGTEGGEKKKDEHIDAVVIEDPGPEQAPEPAPTKEEVPPPPETPPEPQPPQRDLVTSIEERDSRDLPKFERVREALMAPAPGRMFEGRDPRVRTQLVMVEGGSMYTEAAVAQGLRWLARHQADDGHWSLHDFDEHGDCNGRCGGSGIGQSDVGATALALLPFLGAGQTHTRGSYKVTVRTGLEWLLAQQESIGDLRGDGIGRMYAHGIATIVLCEAYALTGDEAFKDPAQRAINWIIRAQHKGSGRNTGGWRYDPGQQGDTSVVGWQLMALRSGRMAGLKVPAKPFLQAGKFLDYVQRGHYGGLYSYQRGRSPDPAMIAEGLLCRQYLGWPASHKGLQEGVEHLLGEHLPHKDEPNIYYWYYGTQVMHHLGGEAWERWNNATREALIKLQDRHGHEQGSWPPQGGAIGGHDVSVGGRLYVTALAVCTLEVYYRHLPLYRSIEIESEE